MRKKNEPIKPPSTRFYDYLPEAKAHMDWLNPFTLDKAKRLERTKLLLQAETAQQARIANLIGLATASGHVPASVVEEARFALFEADPDNPGQSRLRRDVYLSLGLGYKREVAAREETGA